MTFAHEVGHNLGADHDEDSDPAPCPSGFIMSTSGSSQAQPNFSECSIREMTRDGRGTCMGIKRITVHAEGEIKVCWFR